MACCGNTITGAGSVAVDDGKRVNYVQGMLLGVDDFVQEQAYHRARQHELARELLGYGTVRGLRVTVDAGTARVRVTPGMAWTPSGAPVCVGSEQCCDINAWLASHRDAVRAAFGSPAPSPAPLTLHVVLSYRDCAVDAVPIPGEPCRSDDDLSAPSRLADGFRLELRLDAPPQREEMAVRDFADWIARVPVDTGSPPQGEADFLAALRAAAMAWLAPTSPPPPEDFMLGLPPPGLETTDSLLRAALRLWTTELRPLWRARFGCGPGATAPGGADDAVLLATLQLQVAPEDLQVVLASIVLDESRRPVLLSLRMVQELIAQNPAPEPATSVVAETAYGQLATAGTGSAYARADHSHGTPPLPVLAGDATGPVGTTSVVRLRGRTIEATAPSPGDVLALSSTNTWAPKAMPQPAGSVPAGLSFGGAGVVGTNATYARADHVHPLPALPPAPPVPPAATTPPTTLAFGDTAAVGTETAYARADHRHGAASLPALGGDVTGQIGNVRVVRLRGVPLAKNEPVPGQLLMFDGKNWVPGGVEPFSSGIVAVEPAGNALGATVTASGPARAKATRLNAATLEVVVELREIADADGPRKGFTGHLTPEWSDKTPVLAYLRRIEVAAADAVLLSFVIFASGELPNSLHRVHFTLHRFVPVQG
ncbi:hypothetical protein [Piscinibacter defluvii]|uniref:hypothetical protein n=1 Tax=Piscinibacter defluvii TaxID=1796922 RepID=UPI000FDD18C4|nr:hypothetical protein [Piscinibacter defluvii]